MRYSRCNICSTLLFHNIYHVFLTKNIFVTRFSCNGHNAILGLLVIEGHGNNILSRDWINHLAINTKRLDDITSHSSILNVHRGVTNLNELFNRHDHKDIFKEDLGCCKVEAHLYIKPDATPKFCKPHSLPYAYREVIEKELDRLIT